MGDPAGVGDPVARPNAPPETASRLTGDARGDASAGGEGEPGEARAGESVPAEWLGAPAMTSPRTEISRAWEGAPGVQGVGFRVGEFRV